MATISKKSSWTTTSVLTAFFVFIFVTVTSCKNQQGEGNGEWIPTPPDSSALGKIDHFIPIARMDEFKKNYAADKDTLMKCLPGYFMPTSESFNKEWLLKVLKDPACVGLKIYYGVLKSDKANEFRLMIVGVDQQGNDLYITRGSTLANQAGDGGKGGLEWGQCTPPCTGLPPTP
jgi:hypothetical protein